MASVVRPPSTMASMVLPKFQSANRKLYKPANYRFTFPHLGTKHRTISCTSASPWEPPPVTYASKDDTTKGEFLTGPSTLFQTLDSDETKAALNSDETETALNSDETETAESQTSDTEKVDSKVGYIRWPMWLLGPAILLATGMVPTLWLPTSSIFLGPNIASLLSLTGLDCIFNIGASLFLLMADACSRPNVQSQEPTRSRPNFGYGVHKQEADLMVYMTPHRLRGYIQQCHVAATKEGLLQVDWEGTLTFCGFQTFSGEQQEMFELWRRYTNSPQTASLERLTIVV